MPLHLTPLLESIPLQCRPDSAHTLTCKQKIETALFEAAREHGFDCLRYTCWTQDVSPDKTEQHSFSINFSNFPSAWEALYEQQQYYLVDPVLRAIQEAPATPFIWGTWETAWQNAHHQPSGSNPTEKQTYLNNIQTLADQAGTFGLHSGLYLMTCSDSRKLILSLASSQAHQLTAKAICRPLLQELFAMMHLSYHSLSLTKGCGHCNIPLRTGGNAAITLTKAQANILKQFSQHASASTKDIAQSQNISTNTVNFHLKTLRQKLGKPNASGHALANIAKEHGLL